MRNANFLITFETASGAADLAIVRAVSVEAAQAQAQNFLNAYNKGYKVTDVSVATPEDNKTWPALGEIDDL
jgi:hypothetical protein